MRTFKMALALCAVLLAADGFAGAQDAPAEKKDSAWDARIYNIRGKVYLKQNGEEGKWVTLRKGVPLEAGDRIKTGKKAKADISLDDRGIIALEGSTVVVLKTLRHKNSSFILQLGRFVAKVTGLKERAEKMEIRTPSAVAAVRGTEFAMNYDPDSLETAVTVFDEGQVLVTSLDEAGNPVGNSVMLLPRHEVKIKKEMDFVSPYETKDLKTSDSDIIAARKKLSTLSKAYEPMPEKQRGELRKSVLSGKTETEISGNEERSQRPGDPRTGAAGAAADKKDARSGYVRGALNADAPAGANKTRAAGDASAGALQRTGGRSAEDISLSRKSPAGTSGAQSAAGARSALNGSGLQKTPAASSLQKTPAASGIQKTATASGIQKAAAAGAIQRTPAPAAKTPLAAETTIPKLNTAGSLSNTKSATLGADTSRAGTLQEKNVDTIVGQLQNRLAASGNTGAISSSDLRTMVNTAMKGSTNNMDFNQKLNNDISSRLGTNTGATGGTTGTTGTTITTKPAITTKPGVITKPGIISDRPVIETKPTLKRKP